MKHTLLAAKHEIEALRRRNEILQAKVEVMDLFACVFHTSPATYNPPMGVDVSWELGKEIDRIEKDAITPSNGWMPLGTFSGPDKKSVLVFCERDRNSYTAYREAGLWFHYGPGHVQMRETPTLWMPLPVGPAVAAPGPCDIPGCGPNPTIVPPVG